MCYRTFLFDYDGTVLDSKKAVVNVMFRLCLKYGTSTFALEEIDKHFGSSFKAVLDTLDSSRKEEIKTDYYNMMLVEEKKYAKLFPTVRKSLNQMKREGFKLALVTNKEKLIVMEGLKRFELGQFFDSIVTIDDVCNPKPHPEPILKALKMTNTLNEKALMIGDTVYDVGAAGNAGVHCAVIDWYHRYPVDVLKPDYLFYHIEELMNQFVRYKEVI